MKILSSADWHINLHKKKVPYAWQKNRFHLFFDKIYELEKSCDVHVISGDLFDEKPDLDETCLLLGFLNSVSIPTIIIPGNHEATKKGESFWDHFTEENAVRNNRVRISCVNERITIGDVTFQTFPYGSVQLNKVPEYVFNDVLVTHIRGEVPPHISEEFDFERIREWPLILLGDLHFNHRYKNYNAQYPGSPMNTTFDRSSNKTYGVDVINYNEGSYTCNFIDLKLPKLLRKTIGVSDELVPSAYDHVIYEVKGSIDEIAKIQKSDLLDKKIIEKVSTASVLDLRNKDIYQELASYLRYNNMGNSEDELLECFRSLNIPKDML